MDDLARFCCQNPECVDHGKRGAGNLRVWTRYGPDKLRMLYCATCEKRFSERQGTLFFGSPLLKEKIVAILAHLAEGCGVRKTSRLVDVNKNTVLRFAKLAGDHAKALHDELVAFSPRNARGAVRRKVGVRRQKGETL